MTKQRVKLSWWVILQSQIPIRIALKKCKLSLKIYNVLRKDILIYYLLKTIFLNFSYDLF